MSVRVRETTQRRVVVTGTGVVTPLGHTVKEYWSNLLAGRSGIKEITAFDASDLPSRLAGEITDFDPTQYMPRLASRRMDRFAWFAMAATAQAMEQSALTIGEEDRHRVGVLVGSGYGANVAGVKALEGLWRRGPRGIAASYAVSGSPDSAAAEISLHHGAGGPSGTYVTACATGTTCIGEATELIRHGRADAVIAGGSDDPVTRLDIAAMANVRALSRRNDPPEQASRPFDHERDGFVPGAGAGVVVLEEAQRALDRGAPILGEVVGYGATTDAYHSTAPHPEGRGAVAALRTALADARIDPAEVDYVNAHGTSTPLNDATEVTAIRQVFADHATRVPISSTKSMTGHLIAGAGATELIVALQAIEHGVVPPTINCDNPMDEELNFVPHTPQEHTVDIAVSNSFGFGGHNAVLAVRRWEP